MTRPESEPLRVVNLGRVRYAPAFGVQREHLAEVLAAREAGRPECGRLLLVEHEPVITVSRRAAAGSHLLVSEETLRERGVELEATDRGGDITYHGPGQLVGYPILDLNHLNMRLHEYMRLLEGVVIETLGRFGIEGQRDESATGVWVERPGGAAKIAAMGVRVKKWITMHGLSLNVRPDLDHFSLIVPCGLHGRAVTSMSEILGASCPGMDDVRGVLTDVMQSRVSDLRRAAIANRG